MKVVLSIKNINMQLPAAQFSAARRALLAKGYLEISIWHMANLSRGYYTCYTKDKEMLIYNNKGTSSTELFNRSCYIIRDSHDAFIKIRKDVVITKAEEVLYGF